MDAGGEYTGRKNNKNSGLGAFAVNSSGISSELPIFSMSTLENDEQTSLKPNMCGYRNRAFVTQYCEVCEQYSRDTFRGLEINKDTKKVN